MEIRKFKDEAEARRYLMPRIMKTLGKVTKNDVQDALDDIIKTLNDPDGKNVRDEFDSNEIIAAAQFFATYCEIKGISYTEETAPVNNAVQTSDNEVANTNSQSTTKKSSKKPKYKINEGLNFIEAQEKAIYDEVEGKSKSRFEYSTQLNIEYFIFKQDKLEKLLNGTKATPIVISDEAKNDINTYLAKGEKYDPDGVNAQEWSTITSLIDKGSDVDIKFPKSYGKVEGAGIKIPASLSTEEGRIKDGVQWFEREELKAFLLEKTCGGITTSDEGFSVLISEVEGGTIPQNSNGSGIEDATAVIKMKFSGQALLSNDPALAAKHAKFLFVPTETDPAKFTGDEKSVTLVKSVKIFAKGEDGIDYNKKLKTKSMKGKVKMPAMEFNPELKAVGYPEPKVDKSFKITSEDDETAKKQLALVTSAYQQMVKGRVSSTSQKLKDFAKNVNEMKSEQAAKDLSELA